MLMSLKTKDVHCSVSPNLWASDGILILFSLLQHQHSSENNADTPFDFTDKNYDIVSLLASLDQSLKAAQSQKFCCYKLC